VFAYIVDEDPETCKISVTPEIGNITINGKFFISLCLVVLLDL